MSFDEGDKVHIQTLGNSDPMQTEMPDWQVTPPGTQHFPFWRKSWPQSSNQILRWSLWKCNRHVLLVCKSIFKNVFVKLGSLSRFNLHRAAVITDHPSQTCHHLYEIARSTLLCEQVLPSFLEHSLSLFDGADVLDQDPQHQHYACFSLGLRL